MFFTKKKPSWTESEIQELLHKFRLGETVEGLSKYYKCSKKTIRIALDAIFRKMLIDKDLYVLARELDIPFYWIHIAIKK